MWSLTSIVTGQINSLTVLCAMRFVLGMAASASEPAMYSIVSDYFEVGKKRATANAVIMMGSYLGAGLSGLSILLVAS